MVTDCGLSAEALAEDVDYKAYLEASNTRCRLHLTAFLPGDEQELSQPGFLDGLTPNEAPGPG